MSSRSGITLAQAYVSLTIRICGTAGLAKYDSSKTQLVWLHTPEMVLYRKILLCPDVNHLH